MVRRIISLFCVVVILFSCCLSVHADLADVGEYYVTNFWDALQGKDIDVGFKFWKNVTGYFVGQECPSSPDKYHHGPKPAFGSGTGGSDENGRFSWVTCDHCGKQFKVYSSFVGGSGGGFGKSDLQQSYEAQVEELPATGYQSDGSLLYTPSHKYLSFLVASSIYCGHHVGSSTTYVNATFDCDVDLISIYPGDGFSDFQCRSYEGVFSFVAPVSGTYYVIKTPCRTGYYIDLSGAKYDVSINWNEDNGVYYSAGYSFDDVNKYSSSKYYKCLYMKMSPRVYRVVPDIAISGDTYNIHSRPTSITGDYGIIGDNGQIVKVEGNTIVNETNNIVYNPVTGDTSSIIDWSYDYSTRTYTVTLEGGTTQTITYGDENVVIKEGDTIYNVYYLVNGSGSENPGPGPEVCDHTWTETSRTEPTCTTAGKVTSTCSKCSQIKTETIPATGHSWVVDRTVQTTYDEEGNLLQQGYTLYSCSVCGEQYKDMEGTGPPGPEEEKSIWEKIGDLIGTIAGGFLDLIEAVLGKLLDALVSLAEMMMGKFKTIVETILSIFDEVPALFGGFLDFLGAIFPFLPPEITTILTFGVIAITFIGILKAVRR